MSNFKKWLWIPSVVTVPIVATSFVSCAVIPDFDEDLASQLEQLTSDEAKITYANFWSRDAFAELYLKSKNPTNPIDKREKEAVKNYLLDLKFDDETLTEIAGKPILEISTEINDHLFSAFDFFTSWKSSSNLIYFQQQKEIWIEKNLSLNVNGTFYDIKNYFKPEFGYSSSSTDKIKFKEEFELLYKIVQTEIQNELLNMIIAEFYFTASNAELIQKGTTYNQVIDKDVNSIDHWTATSFDINSPTYFLEKYLVQKAPKVKWNYASDDPEQIENWQNKFILNPSDYLELTRGKQSLNTIFSQNLLINSNDQLFNNNALKFKGYNITLESSTPSGEGDLSINEDTIRTFNKTKTGLLNTETNKLVSYDSLDIRKKINDINAKNANSAFLAPISINNLSETIRKKSHQIVMEDLIFNNNDLVLNNQLTEGFNTWKIIDIVPILKSGTAQSIQLKMAYGYNDPATPLLNFENYLYDVFINWNQTPSPSDSQIVSELSDKFTFNDAMANTPFAKQHLYGINPIVAGKINVDYYIRLLPNFIWETENTSNQKKIKTINNQPKAVGKFSMKDTPWEDSASKRILAFYLYMNDPELIKEIKSVLVLNDIALRPGVIKEVNAILEEMGILYIKNKPDYAKPRPQI
ncbi:MAG: hypothetical protein KFW07_02525 [Mycoplasmataceae bacterium]|nr:hypothetical protein [Mycoplasmataceae bacterium]